MNTKESQAELFFHEGVRWMAAGQSERAEQAFAQALKQHPDFPEALANLGWLKAQRGEIEPAKLSYRRALALAPDTVQISLNLGTLLLHERHFAEAENVYLQALQQVPDAPALWSNYGVLLACLKRDDEAKNCYYTALGLDKNYTKARFNLAYVLLRQGRFDEGWQCLEAREGYGHLNQFFSCPRWRGESLAGKSMIIGFESGHGDMIQFCRYAAVLKALGATRLAFVCHPGLKRLFTRMTALDEVFSVDDEIPASAWDFWSPPLTLPFYCQTRLETIPAAIPYLAVDPKLQEKWLAWLPTSGLRVGLAWKGNPNFENDRHRSLPSLSTLFPLGVVEGVRFICLQLGEEEIHPSPEGFSMQILHEKFDDFADTAAVISGLDLVISVDTAVAHLAGALGKPCWLLLSDYCTDWRWLTERSDSPWYPEKMRLFRQSPDAGWEPVIASVAKALALFKNERDGGRSSLEKTD